MLKHPADELERIAGSADHRYRIGKRELKKDGTWRICYDALGVLKSIQARIQCLILKKVSYPHYLQGSIKDTAFEIHYTIGDLARLWRLGRETVRLLVKDEPGVLKIRMGRRKSLTRYSVPESVVRRIHTKLFNPAA